MSTDACQDDHTTGQAVSPDRPVSEPDGRNPTPSLLNGIWVHRGDAVAANFPALARFFVGQVAAQVMIHPVVHGLEPFLDSLMLSACGPGQEWGNDYPLGIELHTTLNIDDVNTVHGSYRKWIDKTFGLRVGGAAARALTDRTLSRDQQASWNRARTEMRRQAKHMAIPVRQYLTPLVEVALEVWEQQYGTAVDQRQQLVSGIDCNGAA